MGKLINLQDKEDVKSQCQSINFIKSHPDDIVHTLQNPATCWKPGLSTCIFDSRVIFQFEY